MPQAYRLDLTVDPSRPRFSGRTEIDVTLARPSAQILLHGRDLAIHRVVAKLGDREVPGRWEQLSPGGLARIGFVEPLPAGAVTLRFEYDAAFNDSPSGLFRAQVDGQWYLWSQFQSIDARAAFPSFDQPSFKTPFEVTLRTPAGLTAIGNAPEVATSSAAGLTVHRFARTLPLPTYLVAMMAGPFVVAKGEVPPTPQRADPLPLRVVSTRPNADRLDFALRESARIVRLLEDYFGSAFPYPKLDQITSPIMPGAMENAGADLYRDDLLTLPDNASTAQQRKFGMVVAHELGHQWFGDLVTPRWWDDLWLNESFANWIGYRIGDAWRPGLNVGAGALAEGFAAMNTDTLLAGRPIRQPIESDAQIDGAFDTITYGKGGHVVAMIAAFLGGEKFRSGVRRYIAGHRHGTATSVDFFAALAEEAGDPRIVPAMRSFVDQQGVPLLVFNRQGDTVRVGQMPYAVKGVDPPERQWGVPLCVRVASGEGERHCELLTAKIASFTVKGAGALIPNADGAGYYRFELGERQWNALIAIADTLSGGEAQAVADSLAASVYAGRGNVSELVRLARVLSRHPDTYAADAATDALGDLVGSGIVDASGRRAWTRLRGRIYAPLLGRYGFDPRAGAYADEPPERSQRRVQIVRKLLGTRTPAASRLRRRLAEAGAFYLAGDAAALDPVWFDRAFPLHVYFTGDAAARALVEKALASEDTMFRSAALEAVGSVADAKTLPWVFKVVTDPRVRMTERRALLDDLMSHGATRAAGYRWITENLDGLMTGSSGIFFTSRLPLLFAYECSVERADEIARDLRPRFAGTAGELELERTIERVRTCGELDKRLGAQLSTALDEMK